MPGGVWLLRRIHDFRGRKGSSVNRRSAPWGSWHRAVHAPVQRTMSTERQPPGPRRGWDSNPRYRCRYTSFPGWPIQPLLHPSGSGGTRKCYPAKGKAGGALLSGSRWMEGASAAHLLRQRATASARLSQVTGTTRVRTVATVRPEDHRHFHRRPAPRVAFSLLQISRSDHCESDVVIVAIHLLAR